MSTRHQPLALREEIFLLLFVVQEYHFAGGRRREHPQYFLLRSRYVHALSDCCRHIGNFWPQVCPYDLHKRFKVKKMVIWKKKKQKNYDNRPASRRKRYSFPSKAASCPCTSRLPWPVSPTRELHTCLYSQTCPKNKYNRYTSLTYNDIILSPLIFNYYLGPRLALPKFYFDWSFSLGVYKIND